LILNGKGLGNQRGAGRFVENVLSVGVHLPPLLGCLAARGTRMHARFCFFYLLGLSLVPAALPAQSHPAKQFRQSKLYVQQSNGEPLQIPREYSVQDTEHEGMSQNANRWNTAVMLRIPGAKSTVRLKEGGTIGFWAELPNKIDPARMELLKFETRGQQRVTLISAFGARNSEPHWNTVSFRARQSRDGRWLLEPTTQLTTAE
jgi:hypothetical protein